MSGRRQKRYRDRVLPGQRHDHTRTYKKGDCKQKRRLMKRRRLDTCAREPAAREYLQIVEVWMAVGIALETQHNPVREIVVTWCLVRRRWQSGAQTQASIMIAFPISRSGGASTTQATEPGVCAWGLIPRPRDLLLLQDVEPQRNPSTLALILQ